MSDHPDRDRRELIPDPTEGVTWPNGASEEAPTVPYMEAAPDSSGNPEPHLRRPAIAERKITLRDLAVPTPNKQPTLPYLDRLPSSHPPPPPDCEQGFPDASEDVTRLRISTEPVTFYIDRDSVPAPPDPSAADTFDSAPTRPLPTLDEATTQMRPNQRPSAMNLGKLASPRFGAMGEPVRIATSKPSAMRLNRVDALLDLPTDATTDAPVETPTELPRNSLSGQRLHRALPILTGLAFVAIGAAITATLLRDPGKNTAPAPSTATPSAVAPRIVARPANSAAPSPSPVVAPVPTPTTAPRAAESAPPRAAPPTSPTTRKRPASRPPPPRSPSPKTEGDGLGELPF